MAHFFALSCGAMKPDRNQAERKTKTAADDCSIAALNVKSVFK
jgi:hypothetical protein